MVLFVMAVTVVVVVDRTCGGMVGVGNVDTSANTANHHHARQPVTTANLLGHLLHLLRNSGKIFDGGGLDLK